MTTFLPQEDHCRLHRTSREWLALTSHRCASPVVVKVTRVAEWYPPQTHLRPHHLQLLCDREMHNHLLALVSTMVSITHLTLRLVCTTNPDWTKLKLLAVRDLTLEVPHGIHHYLTFIYLFRTIGESLRTLVIRGREMYPSLQLHVTEYLPVLEELTVDSPGITVLLGTQPPLPALQRFVRIHPYCPVADILDLAVMPNLRELDESQNSTVDLRGYRVDFRFREGLHPPTQKRRTLKLSSDCERVIFYYSHQEEAVRAPHEFAALCERLTDWHVVFVHSRSRARIT